MTVSSNEIEDVRNVLAILGLPDLDAATVVRLARETEANPDRLKAVAAAIGIHLDEDELDALVDLWALGCPECGSKDSRDLTQDVGYCPDCEAMWCLQCDEPIEAEDGQCDNPECWLNAPDEEDDEFELEPSP